MTSTTSTTVPLPDGHDDPNSEFWIDPELRERYQSTEVPPADLETALDRLRAEENHADLLIGWQRYRDWRQKRLDPDTFRRWLSESTFDTGTEDERPTRYALGTVRDQYAELIPTSYTRPHPAHKRPLSEAQHVATLHAVRLAKVRDQVASESHAAAAAAQRIQQQTCKICGIRDISVSSDFAEWRQRGLRERACAACVDLMPLIRAALEPLPAHATRFEAILDHLSTTPGAVGGVTPAQVAAWMNAEPGDDQDVPDPMAQQSNDPDQRSLDEEPAAITRLRRMFGTKRTGDV